MGDEGGSREMKRESVCRGRGRSCLHAGPVTEKAGPGTAGDAFGGTGRAEPGLAGMGPGSGPRAAQGAFYSFSVSESPFE